jgi:hypothetical protein
VAKKGTGEIIHHVLNNFACPLFLIALPLAARMHMVSGCVKDQAGTPIPGAIVYIEEADGYPKLMQAADAKGCYKLTNVPDGFYEVRAESNGTVIARRNVTVARAWAVTADLQFAPKPPPSGKPSPPMIDLQMLADAGKSSRRESPSAMLKSITFAFNAIDAGNPIMGTIELSNPAPAGGLVVKLAVSHPVLAVIPEETVVPEGVTTVSFPVTTRLVRGPSDIRLTVRVTGSDGTRSGYLTIRSHTRLTVKVEGDGKGRILSVPPGIRCQAAVCTSAFPDGATVQLIPQMDPGTVFEGWSGDCSADGTVVVSGPMQCSTTFSRK